jgi:hypothetical protein
MEANSELAIFGTADTEIQDMSSDLSILLPSVLHASYGASVVFLPS